MTIRFPHPELSHAERAIARRDTAESGWDHQRYPGPRVSPAWDLIPRWMLAYPPGPLPASGTPPKARA